METSRPTLPDLTPIRSILRNVRQVMRDKRSRLEADAPSLLPHPASKAALHLLRDLDVVARGVDGILSNVAHHIFPEAKTDGADSTEQGAASPNSTALPRALAATARRLQVPDVASLVRITRDRLSAIDDAAFDANRAAALLVAINSDIEPETRQAISPVRSPDAMLALFAACLAMLARRTAPIEFDLACESAASLTRAIRPAVLSAVVQRQPAALAVLLAKYAAHV